MNLADKFKLFLNSCFKNCKNCFFILRTSPWKKVKIPLAVLLSVFLTIIFFQNCERADSYKANRKSQVSPSSNQPDNNRQGQQNPQNPPQNPSPGMGLHKAARQGRLDVVKYHIGQQGTNVDAKDGGQLSALFYAVI